MVIRGGLAYLSFDCESIREYAYGWFDVAQPYALRRLSRMSSLSDWLMPFGGWRFVTLGGTWAAGWAENCIQTQQGGVNESQASDAELSDTTWSGVIHGGFDEENFCCYSMAQSKSKTVRY